MSRKIELPSLEELASKYLKLIENPSVRNVSDWALTNSSDEFDEEKNLEFVQKESQDFTKKVSSIFEHSEDA